MKLYAIAVPLCALVLAVPPVGCFGKTPPTDPKLLTVGQIVILPAIDARAGEKEVINLGALSGDVTGALRQKNYSVVESGGTGSPGDIVEEDLTAAKPEWIKRLGPVDARWVMIIVLRDVHTKRTFGSTGNAEVHGYLYDKDSGIIFWQGEGIGKFGQGGLVGMAMKSMMGNAAVGVAATDLVKDFPKAPKKK